MRGVHPPQQLDTPPPLSLVLRPSGSNAASDPHFPMNIPDCRASNPALLCAVGAARSPIGLIPEIAPASPFDITLPPSHPSSSVPRANPEPIAHAQYHGWFSQPPPSRRRRGERDRAHLPRRMRGLLDPNHINPNRVQRPEGRPPHRRAALRRALHGRHRPRPRLPRAGQHRRRRS